MKTTLTRLQKLEAAAVNGVAAEFDFCPHIPVEFVYHERMNEPDTVPACECGKPRFRYALVPATAEDVARAKETNER